MKKIAIIGHFGGKKDFLDGQTVKTKVLYEELLKTQKYNIYKVDTYYKRHNPFKLLWQTFICALFYRDVFLLVSTGGMRVYFPFCAFLNKVFGTNIYHDLIGGSIDKQIIAHPKYKSHLNSFKANFVEANLIIEKLQELGVTNAVKLPNFKQLQVCSPKDYTNDTFRFCTFSRVMEEKGIELAVEAINKINKEYKKDICFLDIYGAVDSGYKERFEKLCTDFGDTVSYKGMVHYKHSTETISKYYALLFPTLFKHEGLPGTILDSYASAVPVIASEWYFSHEIIAQGKTGIIYPFDDKEGLYRSIKWAIEHRQEMNGMRVNCASEYSKYDPQINIKIIERLTIKSQV